MPVPRNPVARAPLLRKGGVHRRARSGQRQDERRLLNELLLDGLKEYREDAKRIGDAERRCTVNGR